MMDLPELIILDVGHGGCAVLRDMNDTIIIDCAPGSTLLETLNALGIHEISNILISHADSDHIAGIITLLTSLEIRVHNIFLNPDAVKDTEIWENFRFAVKDARKRFSNRTRVHTALTIEQTGQFDTEQVKIEVLAPSPELAMSGVGGRDLHGRKLGSNSMSVVLGLVHDTHRVALLPGDIDEVGLSNLGEECSDLRADILIFPHHGGKAGNTDGEKYAYTLSTMVKPKVVFFSFDRNLFNNPREEIIRGVKTAVPKANILCTQLSKKCAVQPPSSSFNHLSTLPAKGRSKNNCCGGSILIKINGRETISNSLFKLHNNFIRSNVPMAMCLRSVNIIE